MIPQERIQVLKDLPIQDQPWVIYWMQAAQRSEYNHALEYAIHQANRLEKPLLVYFGLTAGFPEANLRHYTFMLEGLQEVRNTLADRKIQLLVRLCPPEIGALELSAQAACLVTDRGYLSIERTWREEVARQVYCPFIQVETNVIVPIEACSGKEEYAAATLRGKIHRRLEEFTLPLEERVLKHSSLPLPLPWQGVDLTDIEKVLQELPLDRSVPRVQTYFGGTSRAKARLEAFIEEQLPAYGERRNDPSEEMTSNMSPYLHFGQISPLYIYHQLQESPSDLRKEYLEELIVRRELSMNYVYYQPHYDSYEGLPNWAKETLAKHREDERMWVYSLTELEQANTHDPYWNAAQWEMVLTGKMHNYMRMYWGKKILEWSRTPQEAFQHALYLNNKYALDGRDPNGFAGVAWCFGKHDRPWQERPIFGMVRYMNDKGLERKFKMSGYLQKVQRMQEKNSSK